MSMSTIPRPPPDQQHQRTIDSVAQFIAINGPASEESTRQQNPGFSFLFGGEFSDYYKYRLLSEIQKLQSAAAGGQPPNQGLSAMGHPRPQQSMPNPAEIECRKLDEQIRHLRKQIIDSESNLKAHEVALNVQRQTKVDALWRAQEDKRTNDLIKQVGLNISAFDKHLERLQDSGSKDTISNSKKWIFDNCNSDRMREIILLYLLHRVREKTATDQFRLHVLYLLNDWAHYCHRKKVEAERQMLSQYIPKLYAYATNTAMMANSDFSEKLEKLVGVWEGHKYFDDNCYKQLRNPSAIIATDQATTFAEQHQLSMEVDKEIGSTLDTYTQQHKEFEQHILTKINGVERKLQELQEKMDADRQNRLRAADEERAAAERGRRTSRFDQQQAMMPHQSTPNMNNNHHHQMLFNSPPLPPNAPPNTPISASVPQPGGPPMLHQGRMQQIPMPSGHQTTIPHQHHQPLQQHFPPPTQPQQCQPQPPPTATIPLPPQPQQPQPDPDLLIPKAPYYELPAGMMLPLISDSDITYKPLKPEDLRLPPPEPPNEQLMIEIERFYAGMQIPPPIDCIRDQDGWEMNGLIQHYIKKGEHRIKLEEKMKKEGKKLEDAFLNKYVAPSKHTNNVRKKEEKEKSTVRRSRTRSASSSSSSSSRSSSSGSNSSSSSSSSRSRPSPPPKRERTPPSPIQRRRRRTRSPSPDERPSFSAQNSNFAKSAIAFKIPPVPLNRETNKGAQLMAKMGWEGKGLGAKGQGIEEPVSGGDVRDKEDQYRGVGSKPDIFEQYRKQMSTQMAKKLNKF